MKDCFGMNFGFFFGDKTDYEKRKICYGCKDFDMCFKIALVQNINSLKLEIRQGVRNLRNSLGGSHSEFPFG
jgi:hypothetical protein